MNWSVLLDEAAVAALLSADDAHFAKPVCDGLAVFLQGLPESRQAAILAQQAAMNPTATVAERLGSLAQHCPVLQKIGQVLARDQRLSPELRQQLRQLESLAPTVPLSTIQTILQQEFGSLDQLGITLTPPALAEASVAVVVPFTKQSDPKPLQGVFKILKPGIEGILEHELGLLESVGAHLDERCDELRIPHLDYQEAFQQVRDKFAEEVRLEEEQRKLAAARVFYAGESRVHIPALFDCCSSRVTAMERIWGDKVTDHQFTDQVDKYRLAELI
ncbi:MAG: hypothetical protein KDA57_19705, partial [Planctomycetales bacterium]|nr:hypothetical protein [Planctomycetales bacterium]